MLGIGYPGGPEVDRLAKQGNSRAVDFPRPYLDGNSFEFSFSGIKTSVLYYLRKKGFDRAKADESFVADVCASFQAAVVDVLVQKLIQAATKYAVRDIAVAGGVAANSELRRRLKEETDTRSLGVFIPKFEYCTDNGAMVAMAGYLKMKEGKTTNLEVTAEPNLMLS